MKKRTLVSPKNGKLPFTNEEMWGVIDSIAADHHITPSRLAIRAGLDATVFNICRRRRGEGGRAGPWRALSMETIIKVVEGVGETPRQFARRVDKLREKKDGKSL